MMVSFLKSCLYISVILSSVCFGQKKVCSSTKDELRLLSKTEQCSKFTDAQSAVVIMDCFESVSKFYPNASRECQDRVLSKIKESSVFLLTKFASKISETDNSSNKVDKNLISAFVKLFQNWYLDVGRVVYSDFNNPYADTQFVSDFRKIENSFRTSINEKSVKNLELETVSSLLLESSQIAKSVLNEINSDAAEVPFTLLLSFFEILQERIEMLARFHDLACQFEVCMTSKSETPLIQILNLFASLLSRSDLESALKKTDLLSAHVVSVFQTIHSQYDNLLLPILYGDKSGRLPGLGAEFSAASTRDTRRAALASISFYSFPKNLSRFFSLIDRANTYLYHNHFHDFRGSKDENILDFNPSLKTATKLIDHSRYLSDRIRRNLNEYHAQKNSVLKLIASDPAKEMDLLHFERNSISLQLAEAVNDLNSAESALTNKNVRFSEYMRQIDHIKNSEHFSSYAKTEYNVGNERILVSASDAQFNSIWSEPYNLNKISLPKHVIGSLSSGQNMEVLTIETLGFWSPVCALSKSSFADQARIFPDVGPEGFYFSLSKGGAELSSHSSSKRELSYQDQSVSAQLCLNAQASLGGPGASVGVSASACASYTQGKRKERSVEDAHSSIKEERSSASFAAGLRLADTPFSSYPAGSLLAFIVSDEGNNSDDAVDVQVINRTSSLMLPANHKVYFVVNDCYSSNSQGTLSLNIHRALPKSIAAETLLEAMYDSLPIFEQRAENIKDASTLQSGLKAIRSEIVSHVNSRIASDIRNFPFLTDIVNYWLDNEILQVERKFAIREIKRKIVQLDIKMASLNLQQDLVNERTRIQRVLMQLAINNFDINFFATSMNEALRFSLRTFSPILHLHYPSLIPRVREYAAKLGTLSLDTNISDYADSLIQFLENIDLNVLEKNAFQNSDLSQYQNVLFRIPKPGVSVTDKSSYPTADEVTREMFWSKFFPEEDFVSDDSCLRVQDETIPHLELRPEHLYQPMCMFGGFLCGQFAPVIDSLMLVIVVKENERVSEEYLRRINGGHPKIVINLGPSMEFLTEQGPMHFRITDSDIGAATVPIRFVLENNEDKVFEHLNQLTSLQHSAYGFSPFTTIHFHGLNPLKKLIHQKFEKFGLSEIMIVLKTKIETGLASRNNLEICGSK